MSEEHISTHRSEGAVVWLIERDIAAERDGSRVCLHVRRHGRPSGLLLQEILNIGLVGRGASEAKIAVVSERVGLVLLLGE